MFFTEALLQRKFRVRKIILYSDIFLLLIFLNNDIVNNQLTKFNKKIVSWKSRIFALRNIAKTVLFMRNTGQPELIYRLLGYFFVLILTWEILPVF